MKIKHILVVFAAFGVFYGNCETATNDDDEGENELYEEQYDENADQSDQPLVRCKRPICDMECPDGFQKDDTGCEICHCKTGGGTILGRPDGHERPTSGCEDRVMCTMFCANGFKLDSTGCPLCECNDNDNLLGKPDGHERPTIECDDMAMCLMNCDNGFKTDSNGCRLCECQDKMLGRPDGHELSANCSQMMCRMYCELGFQTDSSGCPVCACLENPCEGVVCETGSECSPQACDNIRSCTRISAKCGPIQQVQPCPEPMCANFCPNGYGKNEHGCMTCDCAAACAACGEGQICRNITTDPLVQSCSVKTKCELARERPLVPGDALPECEPDGSYKPLQCNARKGTCWCVDGLGQEISGTQNSVFVDEHKPRCVRNITTSMHIHMVLVVKHDIDITDQLDSLNVTIIDHVSSWLMIEPHYVKITKAEPRTKSGENGFVYDDITDNAEDSEENDDGSEEKDEDDVPHQLVVELFVIHDGRTDLPSAVDYMTKRIYQGHCEIPVSGGALVPNPKTIETRHMFAQPPPVEYEVIGEPDRCEVDRTYWKCWKHWSGLRIALCAVAGTLFLLTIITMIAALRRRRILRMTQFRHHKLHSHVSIDNSAKNFLGDEPEKQPMGYENDVDKDDKLPIA